MLKRLFAIWLMLILVSCNFWRESRDENPIAKANGNYLYPSDLIAAGEEIIDTASWNQIQIEDWIKRELFYDQAKKEGVDQDIQGKLEDYKQSLMIAAYKNSLLESANIVITEEMIKAYYQSHLGDYYLDNNLYKLSYFILPNDENVDESIKELNENSKPEFLKVYCEEQPNFCLETEIWVEELVLQDLQLPQYLWLSSAKFQPYFKDDGTICIYRIAAKKKKGDPTPLEEVRAEILQVLQFQKENEVISKKEEELFLNAQNKKNFEIYK